MDYVNWLVAKVREGTYWISMLYYLFVGLLFSFFVVFPCISIYQYTLLCLIRFKGLIRILNTLFVLKFFMDYVNWLVAKPWFFDWIPPFVRIFWHFHLSVCVNIPENMGKPSYNTRAYFNKPYMMDDALWKQLITCILSVMLSTAPNLASPRQGGAVHRVRVYNLNSP
jgi:hypothetical protein